MPETIDLTPTPEEMRRVLIFIIKNSDDMPSVTWARTELDRIVDTTEWAKPV